MARNCRSARVCADHQLNLRDIRARYTAVILAGLVRGDVAELLNAGRSSMLPWEGGKMLDDQSTDVINQAAVVAGLAVPVGWRR